MVCGIAVRQAGDGILDYRGGALCAEGFGAAGLTRGFNTSYYRFKNGPENPIHHKAKERIYDLAPLYGWKAGGTPDTETHFPEFDKDALRIITWPMDVCLTKGLMWDKEILDVEVDGEDHRRDGRVKKDNHRDKAAEILGIKVVRIAKDLVIGKNALSDEQLALALGFQKI